MTWLLLTCITASLTLALCWWPFNFSPANVLVVSEQGMDFFNMGLAVERPYGRGQATTVESIWLDAAQGASFQLQKQLILAPNQHRNEPWHGSIERATFHCIFFRLHESFA